MATKPFTKAFTCMNCESLNRKYIGDGFDEFFELYCGEMNGKKIGCVDTFDPAPTLPLWCPRLKATLKIAKEI